MEGEILAQFDLVAENFVGDPVALLAVEVCRKAVKEVIERYADDGK